MHHARDTTQQDMKIKRCDCGIRYAVYQLGPHQHSTIRKMQAEATEKKQWPVNVTYNYSLHQQSFSFDWHFLPIFKCPLNAFKPILSVDFNMQKF